MPLNRRDFIKLFAATALGSGAAAVGGAHYATQVEPKWLLVEQITVHMQGLAPKLDGVKIAQLSDIHLHPHTQIELVERAVEIVNDLNPDLVALTGDYVYGSADSIFELAPVLSTLTSTYGTYSVLGNHDLWTDANIVRAGMVKSGVHMLVNECVKLNINGETLTLAGLDDGWSGQPDLEAALIDAPSDALVILLMHEPDFVNEFSLDERVSLQLSGHTHGGQVRLPGIGAPILPNYGRKYDQGLYQVNDTWLYVNRGLGVIGPPVRFNCRPEITEITLAA